jgi:LPXTG-site transpeptidase (sortase) family protein
MTRAIVFIAFVAGAAALLAMTVFRRSGDSETPPAEVDSMPNLDSPSASDALGRSGQRRYVALLVPASLLVVAFFILVRSGSNDTANTQAVRTETTPVAIAHTVTEGGSTAAPAAPDASSTAVPHGVDVARLVVPSLDIDAPIVTLGVDATGTMEAPDNPTDVAWYDFSARPGEPGNVVLAGHLDYVNYGPAVFYHLKDAKAGDEIELVLVDGTTARYRVDDVTAYDDATAPVQQIVGPTDGEVVTLITCGGSFDQVSREYDKRVVLRAERINDTAVAH